MNDAVTGSTPARSGRGLAVLALSLGAAIRATGDYTVNQAYLRELAAMCGD